MAKATSRPLDKFYPEITYKILAVKPDQEWARAKENPRFSPRHFGGGRGERKEDKSMKAKHWRDLYPIGLFTLLLMSWGLVGSSNPHYPEYSRIDWIQLLQEPVAGQSCK